MRRRTAGSLDSLPLRLEYVEVEYPVLDVWDRIVSCWIANLISSKPDPDGTSCHSLLMQLSPPFLLTVNDDTHIVHICEAGCF
jgi:hypothetical protein